MELGVGEALVSFLDGAGIPSIVERAWILPPQSANGVIEPQILQTLILSDEFEEKYRESYDRESAYEIILAANERKAALAQREAEKNQKTLQRAANAATASVARSVSTNLVNSMLGGRQTSTKTIVKRAAASALSSVMRNGSSSIIRGLLGNIK